MSFKDYGWFRQQYPDVSKSDVVVAAADTGTVTLVPLKVGYSIYVQRLKVTVITSAAVHLTFQDSAGTPVHVEATDDSPTAETPYYWDFGPDGKKLTESKEFDMVISGANGAYHVEFEAYQKQTGVEYIIASGSVANGGAPSATRGQVFA